MVKKTPFIGFPIAFEYAHLTPIESAIAMNSFRKLLSFRKLRHLSTFMGSLSLPLITFDFNGLVYNLNDIPIEFPYSDV